MLIPVDLKGLERDFPEGDIFEDDTHVDIDMMVKKFGAKGTAQKFLDAQRLFLENRGNGPSEEQAKPMRAKEWKELEAALWEGEEEEEENFEGEEEEDWNE